MIFEKVVDFFFIQESYVKISIIDGLDLEFFIYKWLGLLFSYRYWNKNPKLCNYWGFQITILCFQQYFDIFFYIPWMIYILDSDLGWWVQLIIIKGYRLVWCWRIFCLKCELIVFPVLNPYLICIWYRRSSNPVVKTIFLVQNKLLNLCVLFCIWKLCTKYLKIWIKFDLKKICLILLSDYMLQACQHFSLLFCAFPSFQKYGATCHYFVT